jgi:hypothetical protein
VPIENKTAFIFYRITNHYCLQGYILQITIS